jgi:5-methylcytosine-specific restriction enzyme A
MKLCRICSEVKPYEEFSERAEMKDGYKNECKQCTNEKRKEYYANNRDKEKARSKSYSQRTKATKDERAAKRKVLLMRMHVMVRDRLICQACRCEVDFEGKRNSPKRACVDYIIPKQMGGKVDVSNLQTLCRLCMERKARRIAASFQS